MNDKYGKCCFCGDYCNVLSQTCGRCARHPPVHVLKQLGPHKDKDKSKNKKE